MNGRTFLAMGLPRSAAAAQGVPNVVVGKRVRRDRRPNWKTEEISALILAKQELHELEKNTPDGRDLMNPDSGKWTRITVQVNQAGFSPCFRDGPACKSKWNLLLPEYKRIADYFLRTGTNSPNYWSLSVDTRKAEGLPRSFLEEFFYDIHEWYGQASNHVASTREGPSECGQHELHDLVNISLRRN